MSIAVEFNGNVASIILSGGIDYATQEEFKQANKQVLAKNGITEIQVDFAEASFLDSSGIRALILLQKQANTVGKSLILLNCNENMCEIFEIGGFDRIFKFG